MGKVFSGSRQPLMGLANDNPDWQNYYTILTTFHDISRYFTRKFQLPQALGHPILFHRRAGVFQVLGRGRAMCLHSAYLRLSVIWCNAIVFMNSMKR